MDNNMQIIADLHIHSKYSRAVSQKMNLTEISLSASNKGINLVTTGDWTHPLWFREIKSQLKEVALGIFTLKQKPLEQKQDVFFLLSTEISSIYVQDGKQRRIHNLVFSPSLAVCEKIINELQKRGCNLSSDGRPIIGISAKNLLEIVLTIDQNALFIPCHAWTPWFSLYGSRSGFNFIGECFDGLEKYIYAVETGLSSDPSMNWQIGELENRSIVSFSDAHSGIKLGREATVFIPTTPPAIASREFAQALRAGNHQPPTTNFSYFDIINAIKQNSQGKLKIGYTIEFFPEEGKYHWSGHRVCNIKYNPKQVKEKGAICPVCLKPLTIGVENRVIELSNKLISSNDYLTLKNKNDVSFVYDKDKKRKPFVSLVPFFEILLEVNNNSPTKALREYERLTTISSEFDWLLKTPYEKIEKLSGEKLKEAIKIVRNRKVFVDPGFDGVFGKVKVFNQENKQQNTTSQKNEEKQFALF